MALYPTVKALVDDNLPDNISELITAALHRAVEHAIIDACGSAQVIVNPSTTSNPGTPQNPQAHIALPGVYENYINSLAQACEVTAPLGVLKWDGATWEVTQLPFPSAHNYIKCKTTATYTQGTSVSNIAVQMLAGGWAAFAGQWVHLVNRRTGLSDYVQLEQVISSATTNFNIVTRELQQTIPAGSIVEVNPNIGMMWHSEPLVGDSTNNYVDLPASWLLPPAEANNKRVYMQLLHVTLNGVEARFTTENPPTSPNKYTLHATNRRRLIFEDILSVVDEIDVSYWQPRDLSTSS